MQATGRIPVMLDCDPGHDDALAIMLAAASPRLDLRAITTVAGNQTLEKTTLNAQRICTLAGITTVPIAAGCDRPLVRDLDVADDIHGDTGLDGTVFGPVAVDVDPSPAVDVQANVLRDSFEPVTLIAVGPLTNVATLLQRHPDLHGAIKRIVIMGGSTDRGNARPYAEFNIWADPEAAEVVLDSGIATSWHGLNVTHQALVTPEIIDRLKRLDTSLATACVELLLFFRDAYREVFGFADPPLHDPVAVAHVIDPDVVRCSRAPMRIETTGAATAGATVFDLHHQTDWTPEVEVGMQLNRERFWDLMISAIAKLGSAGAQ